MPWHFLGAERANAFVSAAGLGVRVVREYTELELVGGSPDPVQAIYVVGSKP